MQLHELAPGGGFALAHEFGDEVFGLRKIHIAELHGQQSAGVGVERGFPQLLGVHLAQTLEAADAPGAFFHTFLAQLVENRVEFTVVQRVGLGSRLLAACRRIDPEQRRPRHIQMAGFDELWEVPEKQRQQQHLDVRAVDVSVAQNTHLAVAQAAHVGCVVGAVRVNTNRHGDVVNLVVGKEPVALDLPRVEHLAAQGQNRLAFFVAAHLGTAASGVALDQKHFVVSQVFALAIGQLAGQHRHAGTFAFFDFLASFLARLRGANRQLGELFTVRHMLVQPELQCRPDKARNQPDGVTRIQPLLDLALKLRVQHLGGQHIAGARKNVFRQQFHTLGQQ